MEGDKTQEGLEEWPLKADANAGCEGQSLKQELHERCETDETFRAFRVISAFRGSNGLDQ
jgi:hypothetical protein